MIRFVDVIFWASEVLLGVTDWPTVVSSKLQAWRAYVKGASLKDLIFYLWVVVYKHIVRDSE
jgi:hypothetical protein